MNGIPIKLRSTMFNLAPKPKTITELEQCFVKINSEYFLNQVNAMSMEMFSVEYAHILADVRLGDDKQQLFINKDTSKQMHYYDAISDFRFIVDYISHVLIKKYGYGTQHCKISEWVNANLRSDIAEYVIAYNGVGFKEYLESLIK